MTEPERQVAFLVRTIPASLHGAAIELARAQGRSLTWVVIELLRRWVAGGITL